jgi:hypothetical protein
MAEFSDEIVEQAWQNSGSRCECIQTTHWHTGRCLKLLLKDFFRQKNNLYGWEAHSISGLYRDSVSDCQIVCCGCLHKSSYISPS